MLRTSQGDFMKKEFAFAALACGASVAFAANTVNPTFLWDGSTDTEGRVITGSPEETSGWWYDYSEHDSASSAKIVFPPEFDLNTYTGNPFGLMTEEYGGIKVTIELNDYAELPFVGSESPHIGLGFNVWDEEQHGADITAWGGLCLEYSSGMDFVVQIVSEDDGTITGHKDLQKLIGKSDSITTVDFQWKDFSGFVSLATQAAILSKAASVRLAFNGEAESVEFFLKKIGSHVECSGRTDAIKPVANSQANVSVSGRTVNFEGVVPSAKVSVMDLQGHIVKSATAASAMNLNTLPAGIYMLRVQGSNVHYTKQIILK